MLRVMCHDESATLFSEEDLGLVDALADVIVMNMRSSIDHDAIKHQVFVRHVFHSFTQLDARDFHRDSQGHGCV